ncbi:MAG: bacillithiol biosynthesis cysteine-adding enzyme BshC, partial [Candidatus Hydrogenedentes bacterium]|nr:bacillithiol biosynthesis cysteine-adding enzyme BshC [Candidatus Hydrogenedentota bacterium]
MRNLLDEYTRRAEDLTACFAKPLASLFESPPEARPWDAALVSALRAEQERLGSDAAFAGDEAVVVTGQQPGLFTGPLYTVYKAVTAVRLARAVQSRTGAPCVPVFWIGGEDHDFEEVRTAHFLTKSGKPLSLTCTPSTPVEGLPIYRVPVEPSLHDTVERAAAECPGSEFRGEIASFLHDSLDAAESLADWTARLIARLFKGTGLIVFSPQLPAAREAAAPVLAREIAEPLAATRLLTEAGTRLEALGFPVQVAKAAHECCFFVEADGRRRKVVFDDGRYLLPEDGAAYTPAELLELLENAPARFSPNVALRCVVQQRLFPTAAYVAGPGELAYWAQLRPLFEHFAPALPEAAGG